MRPRTHATLSVLALACLSAAPALSQTDVSPEQVADVESKLTAQGYQPGEVDGEMDAATHAALRQFQADWRIAQTGEITDQTLERLNGLPARWETPRDHPDCQIWNSDPKPQTSVTWTGGCVDGKAQGQGRRVWRFKRNGEWVEATYEGGYAAGKEQGEGVYVFASGTRYEGAFDAGEFEGHGVAVTADGRRYEGEWLDHKRHGHGVFEFANGDKYEGDWKDDKRDGHGVYTLAVGGAYDGEWKDDRREGYGVQTYPEGDKYEGEWRAGAPHGHGVVTFWDGGELRGRFDGGDYVGPDGG